MNPLNPLFSGVIAPFAAHLLLLITVICLVALIANRVIFRYSPTIRYTISLIGLIGILLSPIVIGITERLESGLITLSLYRPAPAALPASASYVDSPVDTTVPITNRIYNASITQDYTSLVISVLMAIWGVGLLWHLIRFFQGGYTVYRLKRDLIRWRASAIEESIASFLGRPAPPIFLSPNTESPIAVGVFRSIVILPKLLLSQLTDDQMNQILLHECTHIAERHPFGGLIERIVRALFWPHPLVSALCRELAMAREEVCDAVAARDYGSTSYARTLFAIAQGDFATKDATATPVLALWGQKASLETRIAALVDPRRKKMVHRQREKMWAVAAIATVIVGLTVMTRVVTGTTTKTQDIITAFGSPDPYFMKTVANAKARGVPHPPVNRDTEAEFVAECVLTPPKNDPLVRLIHEGDHQEGPVPIEVAYAAKREAEKEATIGLVGRKRAEIGAPTRVTANAEFVQAMPNVEITQATKVELAQAQGKADAEKREAEREAMEARREAMQARDEAQRERDAAQRAQDEAQRQRDAAQREAAANREAALREAAVIREVALRERDVARREAVAARDQARQARFEAQRQREEVRRATDAALRQAGMGN